MKKIFTHLLLVFILLSMASCKDCTGKKGKSNEKHKIFLVLFDISQSVKKPEIINNYQNAFSQVLKKVKEGDVLVSGLISEKSISEQKLSINQKFELFQASTDNDLYKNAEKQEFDNKLTHLKDSITSIVDSLLKNRESGYTDIFGALLLAEKIYKTYDSFQPVIIMMSDMLESSREYEFENDNLDNKRIDQIITQEKKNGEIPDLKNVKIYVVGAIATNPVRFQQLQNFWVKYFKECHADFNVKNFCSMLVDFNE